MSASLQDIQAATQSTHQLGHKTKRSAALHRLKFAMHRLAGCLKLNGDVQSDITRAQTFPELRHIALLEMGLEDRDVVALLIHTWVQQNTDDEDEWVGTYAARHS